MDLYGSLTSPFVRHCRIALLEGEHAFRLHQADYQSSYDNSPTKKVPFFREGDLFLSDSTSIIMYIREKSGLSFLSTVQEMEHYCLCNTGIDTAINMFLLEKDDLIPEHSPYLQRQADRLGGILEKLNKTKLLPSNGGDAFYRVVCFLQWGLLRQRFTLEPYPGLQKALEEAENLLVFRETAPPVPNIS